MWIPIWFKQSMRICHLISFNSNMRRNPQKIKQQCPDFLFYKYTAVFQQV